MYEISEKNSFKIHWLRGYNRMSTEIAFYEIGARKKEKKKNANIRVFIYDLADIIHSDKPRLEKKS